LASAHSGGGSPFVCFAWPTLNAWSAACQGCSLNTWSLHEPHQTKNLQGKATWHVDKICEHQAKKKTYACNSTTGCFGATCLSQSATSSIQVFYGFL
jgi:hypothetical protein